MTTAEAPGSGQRENWRSETGIPFRSLWTLLVYAADLATFRDRFDTDLDDNPELPEVLGRFLVEVTERRLRRNLSRSYRDCRDDVAKVRGRIDWFETSTRLLLQRGLVACRYQELSVDNPRNRLVLMALERIAACVAQTRLRSDSKRLARTLNLLGVRPVMPTSQELRGDPVPSHQSDDVLVAAVARLVIDLVLPSESAGHIRSSRLARDEQLLWRIFEKGVAGFYRQRFHRKDGWTVFPQRRMDWQTADVSQSGLRFLPNMHPDLTLEHRSGRRIVLDTKFTSILTKNRFGKDVFKSANLYQLYSYLRSQVGIHVNADQAEGVLLYPSIDCDVDEYVEIQGHRIRFLTVNLASSSDAIFQRLSNIIKSRN